MPLSLIASFSSGSIIYFFIAMGMYIAADALPFRIGNNSEQNRIIKRRINIIFPFAFAFLAIFFLKEFMGSAAGSLVVLLVYIAGGLRFRRDLRLTTRDSLVLFDFFTIGPSLATALVLFF